MPSKFFHVVSIFSFLLLKGCKEPDSAETVYRNWLTALSNCELESAKSMTSGQVFDEFTLDVKNCEPYTLEICFLKCDCEADTAMCYVNNKRNGVEMNFQNELWRIDGEWKVVYNYKTLFREDCNGELVFCFFF